MTYPYYNQNYPYYQSSTFTNAMNQNYNQPMQQVQQQGYKMYPVSNIQEAKGAPIDLINGTPSFFLNLSTGEIYFKQFNSANGTNIFKTYAEIQPTEEKPQAINYDKQLNYLCNGIDSLHKMIADLKTIETPIEEEQEEVKKKGTKK